MVLKVVDLYRFKNGLKDDYISKDKLDITLPTFGSYIRDRCEKFLDLHAVFGLAQ